MQSRGQISRTLLGRLVSMAATATAAVAIVAVTALALVPSRTAYASSLSLACPDPILEGDSSRMSVSRSGYRVVHAYIFTHHGHYTAGPEDFVEYHGVKFETESGKKILRVPIVTTEDSLPEHDETFAVGFSDDGEWRQCVVTIEDDDAPAITSVEIASRPVDNYAYRAGDSIDVIVNLDSKVDVEGTPLLSLFLGDGDESTWRGASYHSGSGSRSLVFRYRVRPEDIDMDGISVSSASVGGDHKPTSGFSGSIYAHGTDVPIDYTHPGVTGGRRQKVDGRPYVQTARITSSPPDGWKAYRANQPIEVSMTFDTDVVVEGEVTVDLHIGLDEDNWDEASRQATYLRGSGTDTLVFGYTVRPGDMDPRGIGIAIGIVLGNKQSGFGGSGTIKAKGTDVQRHPFYRGTGHQPGHKVDTEPPAVSSVSFTSKPTNGETYSAGETISVEVVFSEDVTLSGDPSLELDVGAESRQATLQSMPEGTFTKSLVFNYTVQEDDTDRNGISIGPNSLKLNGGGIYDIAGNSSGLSHEAIAAGSGQKVGASDSAGVSGIPVKQDDAVREKP